MGLKRVIIRTLFGPVTLAHRDDDSNGPLKPFGPLSVLRVCIAYY